MADNTAHKTVSGELPADPPDVWVRVAPLCTLHPFPHGSFVVVRGRELAVFRVGPEPTDGFVVTDNACPHAHGNLSGGRILLGEPRTAVGRPTAIVECPWHHWQFDLHSGQCVHNEAVQVVRYPSEVRGPDLYVQLPREQHAVHPESH